MTEKILENFLAKIREINLKLDAILFRLKDSEDDLPEIDIDEEKNE